jgi:hypothetical protein
MAEPITGPTPPGRAPCRPGAETSGSAEGGVDVDAAIAAELRLLTPEVRRSPELAGALLHPDFTEHGASGTVWDRESILAMLVEPPAPGARPIVASRMHGVQLGPDLVHLTFDTDNNGRCAHRSSLWRRTAKGWQLYFHQGTLFLPDAGRRLDDPVAG